MKPIDRFAVWLLDRVARTGKLSVETLQGERVVVGHGPPEADLIVAESGALGDVIRLGATGFARAYMDERITTSDPAALMDWVVANNDAWAPSPVAGLAARLHRAWLRLTPRSRHPRVQKMADHYNLGNDFFAAWLDPTMTYSSARFVHPDQPLAAAQHHKYQTITAFAGLEPGMRVLEIGCGWGGFAEHAAGSLGCSVVGVTIAREQAAYASKRVADSGLSDLVDIRLEDFGEVDGDFDAVVSIEMIESIDESRWPELYGVIASCLRPGGRAVVEAITVPDHLWEHHRRHVGFVRQYVFPGGQIPAPKVLRSLAVDAGLTVEQVETFGLDYARTLAEWRRRFVAAWPELKERGQFDDRFGRMWDLYLLLSEAGFRTGRLDVEHWVLSAG